MIMTRINLNTLARDVTLREKFKGTKKKGKELGIGDVKEVMKLTFEELINKHSEADILKMLERYLG